MGYLIIEMTKICKEVVDKIASGCKKLEGLLMRSIEANESENCDKKTFFLIPTPTKKNWTSFSLFSHFPPRSI